MRIDRLREVQLKSGPERVLPVFVSREGRQRCRRNRRCRGRGGAADPLDEGIAVFIGHGDVRQQYVHALAPQHLERLSRRRGGEHHGLLTPKVLRHNRAAFVIVVDHQHGQAGERRDRLQAGLPGVTRGDVAYGKPHGERRTESFAGAVDRDRAAVCLSQMPGDRQAQPEASMAARR